ncbi:hypothetical protein BC936DRAFT_140350 [Jimgerdemannia flammicorona]|uniref:Uncharacterized protein n=1 Tax=Jimgerdemannia flammicorona TaxID=994334 RepID=A0A433AUU5_9FUNG|nr:hypothetical protein BC936DRAFT_140350 [Jimgerdemannia flammicorona]
MQVLRSGIVPSEDKSESKLLNATSAIQVSTSSSKTIQPLTTGEIIKWNTDYIIQHLTEKFSEDFDEEDFNILRKEKIKGYTFLGLIKENSRHIAWQVDQQKSSSIVSQNKP